MTNKKNTFIENVKKFVGKDVTVHLFGEGEEIIEGFCETIDYIQRSVILRNKEEKILIPRYKYLTRKRSNPE